MKIYKSCFCRHDQMYLHNDCLFIPDNNDKLASAAAFAGMLVDLKCGINVETALKLIDMLNRRLA